MLRAYLHNDYDDDGRVGNDDGDDDDDADECSYLGCIYCRDWMMTFPIGSRGPSVFFSFQSGEIQDEGVPKVRLTFALR